MGTSKTILLLFYLVSVSAAGAMAATFVFRNNCNETIYPGVQTNPRRPAFPTTGFQLQPGVAGTWAGRIWPRHRCSPGGASGGGGLSCASGDCAGRLECAGAGNQPPSTLAEFALGGSGGNDFYDISNVDGFNVPLQIGPAGAGAGCATVTCGADINAACPQELALRAADGGTVGCKSACLAFDTDEHCCRGEYGTPGRCRPSRYSEFFKHKCPQAYSYAYDDRTSTFTCATGAGYNIVFCP
ncbi:hypothetical protein GQ55_2G102400 [Panicum hallii var. hallii]|uniref:Thaumatin-like protein n=1 Tax=Panicum hallii var. hallii TaxID=1504633 RepID=A0A2T7ENH3_9POAL|nr:hypothetical protein GQ55_2G102400 [Panicum hallii var. hallii]